MRADRVIDVEVEMKRLSLAIRELKKTEDWRRYSKVLNDNLYGSPQTAAVRRASMDLTRALARMRKS